MVFESTLGEYSLTKHLLVVLYGSLLFVLLPALIVKVRGQPMWIAVVCMRDAAIGIAFAISFFGALGFFYFVPRAFWRAFVWQDQCERKNA